MRKTKDCLDFMREMGENLYTEEDKRFIFETAFVNSFINGSIMDEEKVDNEESKKVRDMILSNKYWIRNDYKGFCDSLSKSSRIQFLSKYTPEELKNAGVQTYQLQGYNIGYALKPDTDGYTDIISVHNNEPNIAHTGNALIVSAKANGGNKLDHYAGFLDKLYSDNGFEEYDRLPWDDKYADPNWDYATYKRPDVVMRRLPKNS